MAVTNDASRTADRASGSPDANDIIDGPIGRARLRDPSSSGSMGADLDALAAIDPRPDESSVTDGSD